MIEEPVENDFRVAVWNVFDGGGAGLSPFFVNDQLFDLCCIRDGIIFRRSWLWGGEGNKKGLLLNHVDFLLDIWRGWCLDGSTTTVLVCYHFGGCICLGELAHGFVCCA